MNIYNMKDENFKKTDLYKKFMKDNPSNGHLKVRAYAANGAIPISGLKVVVSTNVDDNIIIFYEGVTDDSGLINKINLPAPKLSTNDLTVPKKTEYTITATYLPDNIELIFKVNIYEDICVIQNINIVPKTLEGDFVGN